MAQQYLKEVSALKIRIKFSKTGAVRFIGHLDVMRYFQKLNRRAGIDVKYSTGFSPHQIMSFAAPLGVGLESHGEYVDIEVNSTMSSSESIKALNNASVEGIQVTSYVELPEGTANAMSSVAAADYAVCIKEQYKPTVIADNAMLKERFEEFLSQSSIVVTKASKKSEREVDLRPLIYKASVNENGEIFMQLCTGSAENLKPELVIETFFRYVGDKMSQFALDICRLEVYGLYTSKDENGNVISEKLIPLEQFGKEIL